MKTILLTGGTGYLGSHLAHALVSAGHKVAVLKRTNSKLSRIDSLAPAMEFFNVEDGLERPFRMLGKVHAVIHAATCYGRRGETPSQIFEANTVFPLRLLEAATDAGADNFFNTDTILNEYISVYALSKHQFGQWGRSFANAGKFRFINLRLEHMYGPGDDSGKFTTYVIRNCLNNVPEIRLTSGEQKRDFIHVDDVVRAYMRLLEEVPALSWGHHEFGIGSGQAVSVREFVDKVHRMTNSRSALLFGALPYRKSEVMQSQADTLRLEALGWRCQMSLEQGLQQTIDIERHS